MKNVNSKKYIVLINLEMRKNKKNIFHDLHLLKEYHDAFV